MVKFKALSGHRLQQLLIPEASTIAASSEWICVSGKGEIYVLGFYFTIMPRFLKLDQVLFVLCLVQTNVI